VILEAINMMDECPVGFVVQSKFDDNSFLNQLIPRVPIIGRIIIKYAINNGEIYLRPDKVDSEMPKFYILKGWHVRNLSQRQDELTNGDGSVPLRRGNFRLKDR
jgi:hypothetical protein